MDIKLIEQNKLIVFLDNEDMHNFHITYNSISWQDYNSRIVLAKLLTIAQSKTSFSISKCNLSIEVVPQFNGCAILFISSPKNKNIISKKASAPIIIHTNNVENIMSLCEKSHRYWSELSTNTLFLMSGNYFLLMYPKHQFSTNFKLLIREFGLQINSNSIIIAWLKENTKIICNNNAIQRIGNSIIKTDTY